MTQEFKNPHVMQQRVQPMSTMNEAEKFPEMTEGDTSDKNTAFMLQQNEGDSADEHLRLPSHLQAHSCRKGLQVQESAESLAI